MRSYFKIALKVLRRRKFFTFISLFGISMTLVVLMVATAVLDNFLSPRAPESRFDRVLCVYKIGQYGPHDSETGEPGFAFLDASMRALPGIERAAIFSNPRSTAIYQGNARIETTIKKTDGEYWPLLDFRFVEGRPFTKQQDHSGAFVAIIDDAMRGKLFGNEPALGKSFELEGQRFRVMGVVPRVSMTRIAAWSEVWVPIGATTTSVTRHSLIGGFNGLVLARSRSDFSRLKREFATRVRQFPIDDPRTFTEIRAGLDTPFEAMARELTRNREGDRAAAIAAIVFAVMAVLFMTLPALNLVTLNLSRILERSSEIGVRKAFGASRPALVSQFILENVILTLIGGVIGFALAAAALAAITSSGLIPYTRFDVNPRIFAWGMAIAAFFGLFSGVYPAWRMSRLDPVVALRGGSQ
ncbi:MAG TPA: ABC transporter permease [Thermoanaerobaculia bacterium]|nr:ABC transporter permease [Thermoanaerobaculia bacterium]